MTTNATSPCDSFSVPIPANNSSTTSQRPSLPSASIGQSSTPVNVPRLHLQQLRTWSAQLRAIITVLELFAFVCACAARCDRNCSRWITVFCALCLICFWTALVLLLKRLFESPQLPQSKRWLQIQLVISGSLALIQLFTSLFVSIQGGFFATASFFGVTAACLFALDASHHYQSIQQTS